MANLKIVSLGLAFAIISLTSMQISAAEPFGRLSPQEQALERQRQAKQAKQQAKQAKQQAKQAKQQAQAQRQAKQKKYPLLPIFDPEEIRASREEFERNKRQQAEAAQATIVQQKYSDLYPILQSLEQRLTALEVQAQDLTQRTYKLEKASKVVVQEQPVCCIEANGCTEDQGVGPIPCKNKHTDLICNSCLNLIKNTTNRCPICQEPLMDKN